MNIQFAIQSYKARSLQISAQRLLNLFAEAQPKDAKDSVSVFGTPGIASFTTAGNGPIRGLHTMNEITYAVSGNELYQIDSDGTATELTHTGESPGGAGGDEEPDTEFDSPVSVSIDSSRLPVSMAHNDVRELVFVDGTNGYIYDVANGIRPITDEDFKAANTVTHQDGYFLFDEKDSNNVFISNLRNGSAYDATDFAGAEGQPDDVIAVLSNHREVWVFCEHKTEVWYNSGASDFPFDRIAGAYIERGCLAAHSVAAEDNTVFWLGDDRTAYRAEGYTPRRISTHAIEEAWRQYNTVTDAYAFAYTMAGHKFYVLTFPTADATWVYDMATGLWHERASAGLGRWRVLSYTFNYGKHLVGDTLSGQIGELDLDTYTEWSGSILRSATSPPIARDRKRIFHQRFELDFEFGVGLTSGQGNDPTIWLDWSDDGGHTWSSRKPKRSLGALGNRNARARWLQLGQARERVYRVEMADPVKFSLIAAHLDAMPGVG